MSWEEFKDEKTCPCHKGTYTITRQANDWGQSRVSFEMNCTPCQNTYVQFTSHYHDPGAPGGTSSFDLWVLKIDKQALDNAEKQIRRKKDAILSVAQERYLKEWLGRFGGKTKKSVWAELKSIDRSHVPSLGTFYIHTKNGTLEDYLRTWFDAERIIPIFAFLGIQDSEIAEGNAEVSEQSQNREALKRQMLSRAVHI